MNANDRLLESIYAAATEPGLWPLTLEQVRSTLGVVAVNLIFVDPTDGSPPIMLESGHDPAAVALWQLRANEDPNLAAGAAHPGELVWSDLVMERRAYEMNPFVNEVMRPGGLWHVLGQVSSAPDAIFGAGVHRPRRRPFTAADAARIGPVLRHLHRAMQVHYRLAAAAEEKRTLADLIDHLRAGVMLLDDRATVVLANRAARALAAANDGVALAGGLLAATPAATKALRLAIARVAAGTAGATMLLPRPSGREPYRVLIVPLGPNGMSARANGRRVAALALLTDPDPPLSVAPESLRNYFDLTAAEARVTAELLAGRTTKDIADDLDITCETVRVHVRHILQKSATSSRAELIAKLAAHLPESFVAGSV
jgi:DNA-binding CsgD family transcriptional regulator